MVFHDNRISNRLATKALINLNRNHEFNFHINPKIIIDVIRNSLSTEYEN